MEEFQNIFNTSAMVVDLGSGNIKAGFSEEKQPTCDFKAILGQPKPNIFLPSNYVEQDIVNPNKKVRGMYNLRFPINRGILVEPSDCKMLFSEINDKVKNLYKGKPFFIAEPAFTSLKQKKIIAEYLFDTSNCPKLFFGTQGVLSIYSFGWSHGAVIESGEGLTQVVCVYDGCKIEHATKKIDLAGYDIAEQLKLLLRRNGQYFYSSSERLIMREMKEKVCELSSKKFDENTENTPIKYSLPDGKEFNIGKERFLASEILFDPGLAGRSFSGIHKILNESILESNIDLRAKLYESIIFSGGNTLIKGFSQRMANEIKNIISNNTKLSITATNADRTYLAWQGAIAVLSRGSFSKLWISKKEYHEEGERIFLIKHF